MISSRYRPSFVIITIVLLGVIAIIVSSAIHSRATLLAIAFFPVVVLFLMWRRFFFLRISPDTVFVYTHFKSLKVPISGISSIRLWGRKKVSYGHVDAVTIVAADGSTIQLPDITCENMREIRQHLLERFPGLVRDAPVKVSRPVATGEHTESFRRNFFLTANAIPVVVFALFIGISNLFLHPPLAGRLVMLLPLFIMLLLIGRQLFNFRLTAATLEVRNQFFPWLRETWPLDDIYNIVFESIEGRGRTNILRVHTYDLRSKGYHAIGLRNRDWLALGIALQKRGITVKNELIDVHLP